MSEKVRDPYTGQMTTGHEWNGIAELNAYVPKVVWYCYAITIIYSLIAWVLLPTWPLFSTYTTGILGADQRVLVEEQVAEAEAQRADWETQMETLSIEEIHANPELSAIVARTAPTIFGDNCEACHGATAEGGPGYPNLVDKAWLWGGDEEAIMETLRVGINSPHEDTRFSEMMAYGRDGLLSRDELRTLVAHVRTISHQETSATPEVLAEGEELFATNCASCHGDDGTGMIDVGAPNLTDGFWIYGGDEASIYKTLVNGRKGWMPAWESRLSEAERKMLTAYIIGLGNEAAQSPPPRP